MLEAHQQADPKGRKSRQRVATEGGIVVPEVSARTLLSWQTAWYGNPASLSLSFFTGKMGQIISNSQKYYER